MDVEDRIREAVHEDRPDPSMQFHGRVMTSIADRPTRTRGLALGFAGLLRFAAAAVVLVLVFGAVGLPLMFSRPAAAGPSRSPGVTGGALAATTSQHVPPTTSVAPTPGFMSTDSPGHNYWTSTLLLDGRVLLAGGHEMKIGYFAYATLYDPATGKFTPTGSMTMPRSRMSAIRLLDGRVLIVGGLTGTGVVVPTAEIYDPATGKFTRTGSLNTPRQMNTATLLQDGRVLITGGDVLKPIGSTNGTGVALMAYHAGSTGQTLQYTATQPLVLLASAEIYDPKTGKFSLTGSMTRPREDSTATLLPDGRVLVSGNIGGSDPANPFTDKTAEIYDPATGKFTLTAPLNIARSMAIATVLSDGRILVIAGSADGKSCELYDPNTGKFTLTGSLSIARFGFTSTLLLNGRVLITGGALMNVAGVTASAELYDPTTGTFTVGSAMATAREDAAATRLPDGRVLIGGGLGYSPDLPAGYLADLTSAELYQP
jgi:hypothetical protein